MNGGRERASASSLKQRCTTPHVCGCCDRDRAYDSPRTSVEMFTHSPEKSGLRSVSGPSGDPAECGEPLMLVYHRTCPCVGVVIRYLPIPYTFLACPPHALRG